MRGISSVHARDNHVTRFPVPQDDTNGTIKGSVLMTTIVTQFPRSETASARLIASAWSSYFAGLWRGDPAASGFAEWLAGYWEPSLERPGGAPDAGSALAAGGRGIEWFERDGWVYGVVPGSAGGYRLPRMTILGQPWVRAIATAA